MADKSNNSTTHDNPPPSPDRPVVFTLDDARARFADFTGPCAVASTPLRQLVLPDVPGIDRERVRAAGSLMSIYLHGMRLMFFPAVDRARELLDTPDLCFERDLEGRVTAENLRITLYCWPHHYDRITPTQRATLVARVLGRPHPDAPAELVDTEIEPLLRSLFDAMNSLCDPGPFREAPTPASVDALRLARESVRHRFSRSVTEMVMLQVRDLSHQLETAFAVLTELASRLASPCRIEQDAGLWAGLDRLVGPQLRAEKIDVVSVARAAQAWQKVFEWLADNNVDGMPDEALIGTVTPLCGPVSRLQAPPTTGRLGLGCACGKGTPATAASTAAS